MSPTILVAENDCTKRSLLVGWLEDAGFACVATSVADAVDEAEFHEPAVALVSADVRGAGLEVAHALAHAGATAPMVIVISPPSLQVALVASRLGAIDCLPWPTSEPGVVDAVTRALDHGREASSAEFDPAAMAARVPFAGS